MRRDMFDPYRLDLLEQRLDHIVWQVPAVKGNTELHPAIAERSSCRKFLQGVECEGSDETGIQRKWRPGFDSDCKAVPIHRSNARRDRGSDGSLGYDGEISPYDLPRGNSD